MTEHHDDPALLTGSAALNALSETERSLLEDALTTSPELQSETDSLRETALQLAYAVQPIQPPASLKASLMAQIARTPQAAPAGDVVAHPGLEARPAPASDLASETRVAEPAPFTSTAPAHVPASAAAPNEGTAAAAARRRWFTRPAAALSAAAAVAVVFLGVGLGVGGAFSPSHEPGPGTSQASSGLDRIYAASDFQRSTAKVSGGGTATVVWSNRLGKSAVILNGVQQPPSGKTYQLWYIDSAGTGNKIIGAGLVDEASNGVHSAVLAGTMAKGATIGMTVEPAGGSKQPTTTPVMAVPTNA
ncbi:anti-sigma factor domain-containing protein [Curtobacterium sp. ISL-83]|uniref:anti-sigma factor n=1 Tax=Curtobacterium sp. ISL-83 TaxID=2819145 RepID=UPI001BE745CE|nr:anti-sigma factor [Curtobacterium sp. ISL-83]MBT2501818.1 anti-sigma factor [Curtobacterium sp. ISL-83]